MSKDFKDKESEKLFDFEPDQPDRKFDQGLLRRLYNYAMLQLSNRGLSFISQFMRIASISFVTDGKLIETACIAMRPHNTQVIINVNFILDIVVKPYNVERKFPVEADYNTKESFLADRKAYDDDFTKASKEFASVLAHEIAHNLCNHSSMFYEPLKNEGMKNAAMDVYINHMLKMLGFELDWSRNYLKHDVLKYLSPYVESSESKEKHFIDKCNRVEATVKEIYEFMAKKDPDFKDESQQQVVYVGSHKGQNQDGDQKAQAKGQGKGKGQGQCPDDQAGMIREFAKGCSTFGQYFEEYIMLEKNKNKNFEKALRMAQKLDSLSGQVSRYLKSEEKGDIEQTSNRPPRELSKRDKILIAEGFDPPYFKKYEGRVKTRAILYLDVSGSIYDLVPYLYGMIVKASETFDLSVYVFSTELHPVTMDEIKKGLCKTTGGTCFNTWGGHLVEKFNTNDKITKAIIVTDGYGSMDDSNIKFLRNNKIECNYLVTDGGQLPSELKEFAKNVWNLDEPTT